MYDISITTNTIHWLLVLTAVLNDKAVRYYLKFKGRLFHYLAPTTVKKNHTRTYDKEVLLKAHCQLNVCQNDLIDFRQ